jgi:hypothetical protein
MFTLTFTLVNDSVRVLARVAGSTHRRRRDGAAHQEDWV